MRNHLVETLIFPQLDYACPVYIHLDGTRVKKMQTTMNACVRFVVGNLPRRAHVTPSRLDLGYLSAYRRRAYYICLQAFAVLANARPSYRRKSLRVTRTENLLQPLSFSLFMLIPTTDAHFALYARPRRVAEMPRVSMQSREHLCRWGLESFLSFFLYPTFYEAEGDGLGSPYGDREIA